MSVTSCSCAKTAARIEVPFGVKTDMDPRNIVLDGVEIPPGVGEMGAKNPPNRHVDNGAAQPCCHISRTAGSIDFKFGTDIGVDDAI